MRTLFAVFASKAPSLCLHYGFSYLKKLSVNANHHKEKNFAVSAWNIDAQQIKGNDMTPEHFAELAQQGYNRIPVMREVLADLDTPLSCYLKLASGAYSYLFESTFIEYQRSFSKPLYWNNTTSIPKEPSKKKN